MPKLMNHTIAVIFAVLLTACTSHSQNLVLYEKGKVYPAVKGEVSQVSYFSTLFAHATGEELAAPASQSLSVILQVSNKKTGGGSYSFTVTENILTIAGQSEEALRQGINAFFTQYGGLAAYDFRPAQVKIEVPADLKYSEHYDFEYREPYFAYGMNKAFRNWNRTQHLDDVWGLWGHNIGKKIKVTEPMLARINGAVDEDQLCFSSRELEEALTAYIGRTIQAEPAKRYFMVTPNDSDVACLCDKCKAAGNTPGNASPAVFSMLNRLAKKFPKQQFFSAAYMSTQQAPPFKLEANAGVMISTMAFPKGVVIEHSNKNEKVEGTLAAWKKITGKMYLWDYGVNFDNYNEFYPTLLIAQQNLKFYKDRGISGVFVHGNETGLAAFGDVKAYVYAQLLRDVNLDVRQHIRNFFAGRYPSSAKYLADYYISLEEAALASPRQLDIYGGMRQSRKKYLDEKALLDLYPVLADPFSKPLPEGEQTAYKELLLALTFQRLELMRTNGIGPGGYATVAHRGAVAVVDSEVPSLLQRLRELSTASVQTYNEAGDTLQRYLALWESEITSKEYRNFLLGKKLQLLSAPDEDYADVRMLTDGATGFYDYYNNWMLTTGQPLSVRINAADAEGGSVLQMSFLNSPRHRIYPPQRVIVDVDGVKTETPVAPGGDSASKQVVDIPLAVAPGAKYVTVTLVKQPEYAKRSVACDEIVIK